MLHGYSVLHIFYMSTLFTYILPGYSVYSMQLLCDTYILNGYFVLPLFYMATLLIYIFYMAILCYILHGNFVYIYSMPALLSISLSSVPPLQH